MRRQMIQSTGRLPGQALVLDNLPAHNSRQVDELMAAAGCQMIRLPPYSPEFNAIENAISKVKTVLGKLARRTVPGLLGGIRAALRSVTTADAKGFFAHYGYDTKRRKTL